MGGIFSPKCSRKLNIGAKNFLNWLIKLLLAILYVGNVQKASLLLEVHSEMVVVWDLEVHSDLGSGSAMWRCDLEVHSGLGCGSA